MKVLNLQCAHQHSFEGWFGSEDDFQSQLAGGMVECPMCSDKVIQKMPSAPRLNLLGMGGQASARPAPATAVAQPQTAGSTASTPATIDFPVSNGSGPSPAQQAAFLTALRHVMTHTEDVGERFADEARRMHYGDAEERSIRGQASMQQAVELLEEGIDVMPLLLPAALKETLQ